MHSKIFVTCFIKLIGELAMINHYKCVRLLYQTSYMYITHCMHL